MRQTVIDAYLTNRILTANKEQQLALLMEAGQLFLSKSFRALAAKDFFEYNNALNRVSDIIIECMMRLNHEVPLELVDNLDKIYDWWNSEVLNASTTRNIDNLKIVYSCMGELKTAWEQVGSREKSQEFKPLANILT